ncbi:MAG: SUMF1/EgtB/PvdO family nonheme iron enzyme [Anaerolineae bacterium]|nr:SUMF1/EgtB/PvdO family nonheme iron enzyme [Anaerolineae bacterium]
MIRWIESSLNSVPDMGSPSKKYDARLWGSLLGRDADRRREAVRTIRALEQEQAYARRLLAGLSGWQAWQRANAGESLSLLGDPRLSAPFFLPEMLTVPAGDVILGSPKYLEEIPLHTVRVAEFSLAQLPIAQAAYAVFVDQARYHSPRGWTHRRPISEQENAPVVCVSARDAEAYCAWLSRATGDSYRLPTEAEWVMAARGPDDRRVYPWGDTFDDLRANAWGHRHAGRLCAVGMFLAGRGPFGHDDMAGNIWEWCSSLYWPYPYRADDGREDCAADDLRVMHGGSWRSKPISIRCAARQGELPTDNFEVVGFRVARGK